MQDLKIDCLTDLSMVTGHTHIYMTDNKHIYVYDLSCICVYDLSCICVYDLSCICSKSAKVCLRWENISFDKIEYIFRTCKFRYLYV
jgi:hypothetical protein